MPSITLENKAPIADVLDLGNLLSVASVMAACEAEASIISFTIGS